MPRRSAFVRRLGALVLLACNGAVAATLSAPPGIAHAGQSLVIPTTFTASGSAIAGIQFDIGWNLPLRLTVTIGDQLRQSTKLLFTNPIGGGLRCLIVGLNQDQLPDGELLRLQVGVDASAIPGTATITFSNVMATTPDGKSASVSSSSVSIIIQAGLATLTPDAIVNAASLASGPVSPGEIVSLFGPFTAIAPPVVLFNGLPAPILYTGANQLNAIVPFGLDPGRNVDFELQNGSISANAQLAAAAASPGIFTLSGQGFGPGAILNQDYTGNSATNPAPRGSVIMVFGTGFGSLNAPVADGATVATENGFATPVTAFVGGVPAQVMYAGAAPGMIAGLAQVNIQVPTGIPASSNAMVLVNVAGITSPVGVSVAVK